MGEAYLRGVTWIAVSLFEACGNAMRTECLTRRLIRHQFRKLQAHTRKVAIGRGDEMGTENYSVLVINPKGASIK
jgi:hypothetical protein